VAIFAVTLEGGVCGVSVGVLACVVVAVVVVATLADVTVFVSLFDDPPHPAAATVVAASASVTSCMSNIAIPPKVDLSTAVAPAILHARIAVRGL
jgi:hypothetical protein